MTSSLKLFLILYYIKQIDSKLPCVCSVIDHRGRQNVVRTLVTHLAAPRVPLFCSYHILTSSVIDYWTDARQLGIYLLITTARACFIYLLCTLMTSPNKSIEKKKFPSGWKWYKKIGSYVSCAFIEIWSTWEVWRALKKLELLEA